MMMRKMCRRDGEAVRHQINRQATTIDHHYLSSQRNPYSNEEKEKVKMVCGSYCIPKENPKKPMGEDAHFMNPDAQTVGVADGVGGWAQKGVDSGVYARDLMTNALFATLDKEGPAPVDPTAILRAAYKATAEMELEGSSTACLLSHRDGFLRSANVGDSGFMLFRQKQFICRSRTQQRGFNYPFQLGNSKHCDTPDTAEVMEIAVDAGDIVVLATDGFLDNVFASEVEDILDRKMAEVKPEQKAQNMALLLAKLALFNSFDKLRATPFSVAARKAGISHAGGKLDDITVVVCLILPEDDTTTP